MSFVIQIEWLGGAQGRIEPDKSEGQFVLNFDPDAHDGMGHLWTAAKPQDAIQFAGYKEALEYYRQVSHVRPVRDDGKPNRPLTAFTVSIFDPEAQR